MQVDVRLQPDGRPVRGAHVGRVHGVAPVAEAVSVGVLQLLVDPVGEAVVGAQVEAVHREGVDLRLAAQTVEDAVGVLEARGAGDERLAHQRTQTPAAVDVAQADRVADPLVPAVEAEGHEVAVLEGVAQLHREVVLGGQGRRTHRPDAHPGDHPRGDHQVQVGLQEGRGAEGGAHRDPDRLGGGRLDQDHATRRGREAHQRVLVEPEAEHRHELGYEGDPVLHEAVQVLLYVGAVQVAPVDRLEPVAGAQGQVVAHRAGLRGARVDRLHVEHVGDRVGGQGAGAAHLLPGLVGVGVHVVPEDPHPQAAELGVEAGVGEQAPQPVLPQHADGGEGVVDVGGAALQPQGDLRGGGEPDPGVGPQRPNGQLHVLGGGDHVGAGAVLQLEPVGLLVAHRALVLEDPLPAREAGVAHERVAASGGDVDLAAVSGLGLLGDDVDHPGEGVGAV